MRQLLLDLFGAVAGSAPDSQQNQPFSPAQQASAAPDLIVDEAPLPLPQALAPARFSHPQANRHIVLGAARVDYLFRRGRRRTIGLAIGPDGLQVSAPRWTTVAEVEAALHEKSRWVLAKLSASRQRQAELQLGNIRGQVEEDVRLAFASVRTSADQVRAADLAVSLAERELQMSRDRFRAGVADNIEVITAQAALSNARETQVAALAQYNAARINLAAALGRAEGFRF